MSDVPSADERMRADVLDGLGLAVIVTDVDGTVTYWNARAEELYGWTAAEAVGRPIVSLTVPSVGQEVGREIMRALREGRQWTGVFPVRRKDGSTFVALVTDTAVRDGDGRVVGIAGASTNIGAVLRPYLAHSREAVLVCDRDGTVRYASPSTDGLLGRPPETLVGQALTDLLHADDVAAASAALASATADDPSAAEVRLRTDDGPPLWVEVTCTDLHADPTIAGLLCGLRDVTERRDALDRLATMATTDPVTGLANRFVLTEQLTHAAARRERRGAVLFLDVDDLKAVNDEHGHVAGDAVLRAVGDRIAGGVRPGDVVGRWAGDEFVVLADDVRTAAQADELVRRLQRLVSTPVDVGGRPVVPSVSAGHVLLSQVDGDVDVLVRRADEAMYRAKRRRDLPAPRGAGVPGHVR